MLSWQEGASGLSVWAADGEPGLACAWQARWGRLGPGVLGVLWPGSPLCTEARTPGTLGSPALGGQLAREGVYIRSLGGVYLNFDL